MQGFVDQSHAARFEVLFSRYNRDLRRFLGRRLTNKSDVEDCLQETYLSIWRQEARGHLRDNPRGYLFITALNVTRALWRKEKPRRQFNHAALSEHFDLAHSVESEKTLREREAIRLIGNQLDTLKLPARSVFLMHHIDGLSVEDIADRLGISTRTVERHMARALDHCRATLGGGLRDILE
jgi:RNA polymerase sigma factor (sigma-70 family)